jgi:hypothetical protein
MLFTVYVCGFLCGDMVWRAWGNLYDEQRKSCFVNLWRGGKLRSGLFQLFLPFISCLRAHHWGSAMRASRGDAMHRSSTLLCQLLATFAMVSASGLGQDEGLAGPPLLTELSDDACEGLQQTVGRACDGPSAARRTCARMRREYAHRCGERDARGESQELREMLLQLAEGDSYSGKDGVYPPIVKDATTVPGKKADRRPSSSSELLPGQPPCRPTVFALPPHCRSHFS